MGWVFDPEWGPNLLVSWDTYELTGGGEFFKQALHGQIITAPPTVSGK